MVTALSWTVDTTFIRLYRYFLVLGRLACCSLHPANQNRRMKSSFVKCLEHIDEFWVNSHLARFCFEKSIHFFLRFLTSVIIKRYSVQNHTLLHIWEGSTSTYHISSRHISSSAQRMYRQMSERSVAEIPCRRHKLVSAQSLNCSFFCIQYGGKQPILGFCLIKT